MHSQNKSPLRNRIHYGDPFYKQVVQNPPNRFGIPPGMEWDLVDRSNGFEELYFLHVNEVKLNKSNEYKNETKDL